MRYQPEIIREHIENLRGSITLFSNPKKKERELWVVKEFLRVLGVAFKEEDFKIDCTEPVDISFRNADFQIKELLDPNRKRHKELKDELVKVQNVKSLQELFEPYDCLGKISLQKIVDDIRARLNNYLIAPIQRKKVDFLVYENLTYHAISDFNYTLPKEFKIWRSFSMVANGGLCCVFSATEDAPDFIRSNLGKVIKP